jgi:phosphinothricin acetyltransferase
MATEVDAGEIAAIYAFYVTSSPATFETEPPTQEEMRSRIARVTAKYPWLIVEGENGIEGYAYANFHRERLAYQWATEVSAYIHPECHRRGHGRRLYGVVLEMARRQGFFTACAGITMPNEGSVGLHQSMGFQLIGVYKQIGFKLGEWHDTSWWQLELSPRIAAPPEPRPWCEIDLSGLEL